MNTTKSAVSNSIIIIVIVFCSIFSARTSYCDSFADVADKAKQYVVKIVVYDITGKEVEQGSGFFIDNEGHIITNAHVMKDAYSAEVFSELNYYRKISIINYDEKLDLTLLQVRVNKESYLELDYEYEIKPDNRVFVISYQSGLEKTVSHGSISSVSSDEEPLEVIYTTMPILPGASNGPLLNMSGKVIGVTTAKTDKDKTFHATSIRSIKSFLSKPHKVERLHPPKSKSWFKWIIKWVEMTVIGGLLDLFFVAGPAKVVAVVLVIIAIAFFFQWLFEKKTSEKKW